MIFCQIVQTTFSSVEQYMNQEALGIAIYIFNFVIVLSYPTNFFIYCIMSKQFRKEFRKTFIPKTGEHDSAWWDLEIQSSLPWRSGFHFQSYEHDNKCKVKKEITSEKSTNQSVIWENAKIRLPPAIPDPKPRVTEIRP